MNKARTSRSNRAETVPIFELIDKDGAVRARSHCGLTLAIAARDLLPDQEQDPDRIGRGWDIQVAHA
jgi:hypothetical protein